LHPGDEAVAEEQVRQWRGLLKAEGGAVLAAVLGEWEWPMRAGLKEAVTGLIGYLGRHADRMEYPRIPGARLVHRQRCGGERVQDGGGPAAEAGGDALG
jgi:hypothetical protein